MRRVNEGIRNAVLSDNTAEAKLETIMLIMSQETFGQRKSAMLVGGLKRLERLMVEGKIRWDKSTCTQNGKWFCNAADVLKYAIKPSMRARRRK